MSMPPDEIAEARRIIERLTGKRWSEIEIALAEHRAAKLSAFLATQPKPEGENP